MPRLIETKIGDITDPELRSFVLELEHATKRVPVDSEWLLHYLQNCHHPWPDGRWRRIEKSRINPVGVLSCRVGKLGSNPVRQVCEEVGAIGGVSLEAVERMQLYEFLNKYDPLRPKRDKPSDPRDIMDRWT